MKYMEMSKSPAGHEVLCKQYLRAFLEISVYRSHNKTKVVDSKKFSPGVGLILEISGLNQLPYYTATFA